MAKASGEKVKKTSPMEFLRQVRSETRKVTWPSRHETTVSTISVFIMVVIAAVFLYLSDQIIAFFVNLILGFGL